MQLSNKNKGGILTRKWFVFFAITIIIGISGCLGPYNINEVEKRTPDINKTQVEPSSVIEKNQGIFDNAKRLYEDYEWKLALVTEIQNRTDALGTSATKDMYIEWKRRNNEAIDTGERLATYITEHKDILNQYWTSDILVLIAKNKVTFERDNQALEQTIDSLELGAKLYGWRIDYYGREGSKDLGTLIFENRGPNLSNIKLIFQFYTSSGASYASESLYVGDIASGKTVRKKVSLPGRYWGEETWSREKMFLYINGSLEELWVYENDEWKEQQTNKT